MKYKRHVFVCINQKPDGKKCCGEEHGLKLVEMLRERLLKDGLNIEMRAQKAGCLSACSLGPAMVIYPEGIYYGNVQESDIDEIYEKHIKNGEIVERLKLDY